MFVPRTRKNTRKRVTIFHARGEEKVSRDIFSRQGRGKHPPTYPPTHTRMYDTCTTRTFGRAVRRVDAEVLECVE